MTAKIDALDLIRQRLEASLVLLQEEELELDDERKHQPKAPPSSPLCLFSNYVLQSKVSKNSWLFHNYQLRRVLAPMLLAHYRVLVEALVVDEVQLSCHLNMMICLLV